MILCGVLVASWLFTNQQEHFAQYFTMYKGVLMKFCNDSCKVQICPVVWISTRCVNVARPYFHINLNNAR